MWETLPLAISPPGDIVLDVVRAADPAAAEAARARLASLAGRTPETGFSAAGGIARSHESASSARMSPAAEAFTKFEAVVLQTFVQTMLPKETESVYGQGVAGEMWQSLLAEQLANQMAARGGIGIAERILRDHYQAQQKPPLQEARAEAADLSEQDTQEMLSVALVQEIQRRTAQSLNEDSAAISTTTTSR